MNSINHEKLKSAIFSGGCFWCVETDFKRRSDIKDIESGYIGGKTDNPSYETAAKNGHREAVRVWYDPEETDYHDLVAYFFATHDPTDSGGSFADRGHTYTSAIYYQNDHQKAVAHKAKAALEKADVFADPVVTEILPADTFWRAEDYHQDYAQKNETRYQRYRNASGREGFVNEHKEDVFKAITERR
jgi:methionine-S-sulfoxide reductase